MIAVLSSGGPPPAPLTAALAEALPDDGFGVLMAKIPLTAESTAEVPLEEEVEVPDLLAAEALLPPLPALTPPRADATSPDLAPVTAQAGPCPLTKPDAAAPPDAVPPPEPRQTAPSPTGDQSPAAPPAEGGEAHGGGTESALLFRLAEVAPDVIADGPALDLPLADTPTRLPIPEAAVPRPQAVPQPLPQQQAAAELASLLRDHGGTLTSKESSVELVLSPEELGRIRFELRPNGDGVQVTLSADRPETLELLRRHADELVQELRKAGFTAADLGFSGGDSSEGRPPDLPAAEFEARPDPIPETPAPFRRLAGPGVLDLRL